MTGSREILPRRLTFKCHATMSGSRDVTTKRLRSSWRGCLLVLFVEIAFDRGHCWWCGFFSCVLCNDLCWRKNERGEKEEIVFWVYYTYLNIFFLFIKKIFGLLSWVGVLRFLHESWPLNFPSRGCVREFSVKDLIYAKIVEVFFSKRW